MVQPNNSQPEKSDKLRALEEIAQARERNGRRDHDGTGEHAATYVSRLISSLRDLPGWVQILVVVMIISIGMVTVQFVMFAMLSLRERDNQSSSPQTHIILEHEPGTPIEGRRYCMDTDAHEKPDDIYIKGRVIFLDESGNEATMYDACNGSKTQVNEMWCYESPEGSGDFVPGRMVYNCPNGCFDGACDRE